MDQQPMHAVTRTLRRLPSRRDVLRGLAGAGLGLNGLWLAGGVAAKKKPCPPCKKRKQGKCKKKLPDGTVCGDGKTCQRGSCLAAGVPPPGGCTPNCDRRVCGDDGCGGLCGSCPSEQVCQPGGGACSCPAGKQLLSNGTCAIVCSTGSCGPSPCDGCSAPNVEGARHCSTDAVIPNVTCTSTTDCPRGSHCQLIGGVNICAQLCT